MLSRKRLVVQGLRELADDIITGERIVDNTNWYETGFTDAKSQVVIVPKAIHETICSSHSVIIDDKECSLTVCGNCMLAVENEHA